jgi:uncharacterized protein (DUF427 family)
MTIAIWNNVVLAESEEGIVVEGNYYFPPNSIDRQYLRESETHTTCGWKGVASYYDIVVNGEVNKDGAWYYSSPKEAAKHIQGLCGLPEGCKSGGLARIFMNRLRRPWI